MERLARLRALDAEERQVLAEAFLSLGLAWLVVVLLPFRLIGRLGGKTLPGKPLPDDRRAIARVGWAVRAAARRVPFRAKCFEQGLAAWWLLRRRGIDATLHYGAARHDEGLVAHVWVTAGDDEVIGCANKHLFSELTRFPERPGTSHT